VADDPPDAVVAVVDDDQRILDALQTLLESAGYAVRLFTSATALLETGNFQEIDCVISDIDMPAIDGLELSRRLETARPQLPIILITGHPELLNRSPSIAGASRHKLFTKPYDPDELLAAIGKVVRKH
jgi:FixJ family two-component response regulator